MKELNILLVDDTISNINALQSIINLIKIKDIKINIEKKFDGL